MRLTTWRELLQVETSGEPVVAVAPDEAVLDVEFDNSYGAEEGPPFLAWTATRVFFPVVYDGAEWVGSAPRYPQPEPQKHVGR